MYIFFSIYQHLSYDTRLEIKGQGKRFFVSIDGTFRRRVEGGKKKINEKINFM